MLLGRALPVAALLGATLFSPTARACPWDNETYAAEAASLPCVFDTLIGAFPRHSKAFHEARLRAAEAVLDWAPAHLDALDAKGVALMKLGRLDEARAVMTRRAALAPRDYASHANLGTIYTFTGEWPKALAAIDRALAIDPEAHFGREKYHKKLVEFLQRIAADPSLALRENFLGIELTEEDRIHGSKQAFSRAGAEESAFDALVSMIAVYGADQISHVYFAFGELLALHGDKRLAWTAYQRALELDHPRKKEIRIWQNALSARLHAQYKTNRQAWLDGIPKLPEHPLPYSKQWGHSALGDIYTDISRAYREFREGRKPEFAEYRRSAERFTAWEQKEIESGLPVWRREGLEKVYARANALRPRCKSPGVILDEPLSGTAR
jgi:tetratricopeptide (TPR) repeat protein